MNLGITSGNSIFESHDSRSDTIPCPPLTFDQDETFDIEFVEHFAELMTSLLEDIDEDEIPTVNTSLEIIAA